MIPAIFFHGIAGWPVPNFGSRNPFIILKTWPQLLSPKQQRGFYETIVKMALPAGQQVYATVYG